MRATLAVALLVHTKTFTPCLPATRRSPSVSMPTTEFAASKAAEPPPSGRKFSRWRRRLWRSRTGNRLTAWLIGPAATASFSGLLCKCFVDGVSRRVAAGNEPGLVLQDATDDLV